MTKRGRSYEADYTPEDGKTIRMTRWVVYGTSGEPTLEQRTAIDNPESPRLQPGEYVKKSLKHKGMTRRSLFGTRNFPFANDGKRHILTIEKTGLVISPDDGRAYVTCYGKVDGDSTMLPMFRPTRRNLQAILNALGVGEDTFNRSLDELLVGKTFLAGFRTFGTKVKTGIISFYRVDDSGTTRLGDIMVE
ncbi:MAG: hypothetical protein ACI4CE_07440 [Methanomethylophilus alvi]